MRLLLVAVLALSAPYAIAGTSPANCMDTAQSQSAMNGCARHYLAKADAELNRVYKEILARYKDNASFINRLRAAQVAWLKFRDAELEMKYPPQADENYYGSVLPMCQSLYLEQLTNARIATLKQWLEGIPEGDVCTGSVMHPRELGQ